MNADPTRDRGFRVYQAGNVVLQSIRSSPIGG
jgi:hypothetical protein